MKNINDNLIKQLKEKINNYIKNKELNTKNRLIFNYK